MEYLKVWVSFREQIAPLTDSEKGRLFVAMLEYAENGKEPTFKSNERFLWPTAKQDIDRTAQKAEVLKTNGAKGGRPKTTEKQEEPTETKEKQTKAFRPPTVEEVAAYCKERGNNVDPERFVAFYGSKGWKVGSQPMKDWKMAVVTWEKRNNENVRTDNRGNETKRADYSFLRT